MNKVRTKIVNDLFNALHQANLADCNDVDYANDLDDISSCQDNLYGHISEALKLLEPEMYWQYCETGDIHPLKEED
jgi:hypothetical protein